MKFELTDEEINLIKYVFFYADETNLFSEEDEAIAVQIMFKLFGLKK